MEKLSINIVYYSGTGSTESVAKCFEKLLREAGYLVTIQRLTKSAELKKTEKGLLLLLYAVHACNAPEAVYQWIECVERVDRLPAIVISVSGGGEVMPNTACRTSTIKRLEKKGYHVIYEKMIVMPSNFIVATRQPLAQKLLQVLPSKVKSIIRDIEQGVIIRSKPLLIDRLFSCVGELEKIGARLFGKRIKISGNCTGCGWCSANCPSGNIEMKSNIPQFGNKCHLCLNCIYGCPERALKPGSGKFIIIKEGYNLKELEKMQPLTEEIDVEKLAKGFLWSGVRKYLLED